MSDANDRFITFSPYEAEDLTVYGILYAGPQGIGYVSVKEAFDDIDFETAIALLEQWVADLNEELDAHNAAIEGDDDETDDSDYETEDDFGDDEEEDFDGWNLYAGVWNDGDTTSLEFDDSFHDLDADTRIALLTDIATAAMAGVEAIRAGQDDAE